MFFYAVHPRIWGYELLPSLASARKITFGSIVSCKWTRQLRRLDSINSSFRVNWGLFRHSTAYMASLRRRNTTDRRTLLLLREGEKYYRKSKLFEGNMTFQGCLSSAFTKYWPPLKFTGETPYWINWNSFAFSSGCYKTVHNLTDE